MKNQNKSNAGRTQIADISVAGKELSEEHLRIVAGGRTSLKFSGVTTICDRTCVRTFLSPFAICFDDCTDQDDSALLGIQH